MSASTGALARLLEQVTPRELDSETRVHVRYSTANGIDAKRFYSESDSLLDALAPDAVRLLTDMAAELAAWKMSSGDFVQVVSTEALLARFAALEKRAVG